MKKLITVMLLVMSGTTLIQAQLQAHRRGRASASLSSISFSASSVVGGDSLIGTVHLTAPAPSEGAVVTLVLNEPSDPSVIPVSVLIPTGATSANFADSYRDNLGYLWCYTARLVHSDGCCFHAKPNSRSRFRRHDEDDDANF